jgi:putative transposase
VSGVLQDIQLRKGTVVKNKYQTTVHTGRTTPKKLKLDVTRAAQEAALARLPQTVTIAIADLAGELEEGLRAFAVGTGLKVLDVILEGEAAAICGPRGRHDPDRRALRHGYDSGLVTLGGRQIPITRPRLRSADRACEVPLPTYEAASSTELLGQEAMAKMLAKLSTRRHAVGLEPVGSAIQARSRGTTRSAVSRRFVAATEAALDELMSAALSGTDLVVIMIDGVNFADHCCVVALGIDIDGNKAPLALVEGDTENATLVGELLVGLRERALDVTKPTLFVIDGSKALPPAIKAVFDHPVIARCQEHKVRNVRRHLADEVGRVVEKRMRAAYRHEDPLVGQAQMEALAKELDRSHPGAAASLREGLADTFTVARLGVPPTLARTVRSTNPIESMIEICRDHCRNVKRWKDGKMVLRWCAAGVVEARKQFRRVNGHLHLRKLRAALEAHVATTKRRSTGRKEAA